MTASKSSFHPDEYEIACVCPLYLEAAPMEAMLDETHSCPILGKHNNYTLGTMSGHKTVIATLPETGTSTAASIATQILNDFKSVKYAFLVGVGGGLPDDADDIRLGDVVMSQPRGTCSGVVQFDRGKIHAEGPFELTGSLSKPPQILIETMQRLRSRHARGESRVPMILAEMLQTHPHMGNNGYCHPGVDEDKLFRSDYDHQLGDRACERCDPAYLVKRIPRMNTSPQVHYGTIGSSNALIKSGKARDALKQRLGLLCVEMEAAGLMDCFPCLVVRGICDYADSHKNKRWQRYAAAVAAAYTKELVSMIPPSTTATDESPPLQTTANQSESNRNQVNVTFSGQKIFHSSSFNSGGGPMYF